MSQLEEVFHNKLRSFGKKEQKLKLCVAASGGVDSTVLFRLLLREREKFPFLNLALAHVNYALRGEESEKDEAFVASLAESSGVSFFCCHPEKTKKIVEKKVGVQAWARRERYKFFETLVKDGWYVVLAHTKDDLLETILMRLLRGTSPLACRGMSEFYGAFWRPLLGASKEELLNWAKEERFSWREDKSNALRQYSRNKVRLDLIPQLENLYPGSGNRLVRFAEESQEFAAYTRDSLKERFELSCARSLDTFSIELTFFSGLSKSVICLFLAKALREFSHSSYVPEHKLLVALHDWVLTPFVSRPKRQLSQDMFCKLSQNKLIFTRL